MQRIFLPIFTALLSFLAFCLSNPAGQYAGKGTLYVTNNSPYSIYNLYLSSSGAFGNDLLSAGIDPGRRGSVQGITPGTYTVKLRTLEGFCARIDGVTLAADSTVILVLVDSVFSQCPAGIGTLRIINTSETAVYNLYVRPWGTVDWGNDLLGEDVLLPGAGFDIKDLPSGIYDARAQTRNGSSYSQIFKQTVEDGTVTVWTITNL